MKNNARGLLLKAIFLLAGLALATTSQAAPFTITLTGNVQTSEVPEIAEDTFAKFVVTYDSSLVPTDGTLVPPLIAIYGSPASTWSIQIGSYVTSGIGGAVGVREELLLGEDGFFGQIIADPLSNSAGIFAPGSGLAGLPLFSASFDLANSAVDLWSGLDLPTSVFPYDKSLLMLDFFIKGSGFNTDKQVRANIISFTIEPAVAETPLPAALPLFATGLGALGLATWRRKRRTRSQFFAALAAFFFAAANSANAVPTVTIQPVSVCLDNGTSCSTAAFDANVVKTFWQTQAGLTLNFLTPLNSSSTAFKTLDTLAEVQSLLSNSSGVDPGHPASLIFWYADAAPGLQLLSLGFVSGNGSWVASNITGNEANIGFSRALGFNLGLALLSPTPPGEQLNLMVSLPLIAGEPFDSLHLNDQQRAQILRSRLVEDIAPSATPLPSAAVLFGTVAAGGGLLWRRRRKTAG